MLIESFRVAEANVEQALQQIYAIRVSLGLPAKPARGEDLAQVPPDLDQNFSAVRQALGELLQSAAHSVTIRPPGPRHPKEAIAAFYKQDPQGNLNRIYARLIPAAIEQAEAELLPGTRAIWILAELNLRYLYDRQRDRRSGDRSQRQSGR